MPNDFNGNVHLAYPSLRLAAAAGLLLLLQACAVHGPSHHPDRNWNLQPNETPSGLSLERQSFMQRLLASYPDGKDPGSSVTESAWLAFLAGQQGKPPLEQLRAVNLYVNRQVPYRTDTSNWLRKDIWNTPREALMRGGDCEDMALLKMVSLHLLGWPHERLHIVIGARDRDGTRQSHALLMAELVDSTQVLLDNQVRILTSPRDYFPDFKPVLALSAQSYRPLRVN